jgi:flagellar basal body-associated protein FliL
MNGLEIIILIVLIAIMAAGVGYFLTHGQPTLKEMTEEPKEKFQPRKVTVQAPTRQVNDVVKEVIDATEPKIKKENQTESEFPIDKPKKKRKYYPKKK